WIPPARNAKDRELAWTAFPPPVAWRHPRAGETTMPDPTDNRILADLCRAGDPEAARLLFDRYVDRLVALARRRLSQALAARVDPEDIVQSVFRTFFGRLKQGRFQLDEQDDLCKLLVRITVHKTLRQVAFQKAAKRDPSQEAGQQDAGQERLLALLDR